MRLCDYSANIRRAYERSQPSHRISGERWYRRMSSICAGHADRLGVTPLTIGMVYASFSINTPWKRNLSLAARFLRGRAFEDGKGTLGCSIDKATASLVYGLPIDSLVRERSNHKLRNFARACSGDYSAVVVDRWAWGIANGWKNCPNDGAPCSKNKRGHACSKVPTGEEYLTIAKAYANTARRLGLEPAMLQAIVWVAAR